MVWSDRMTVGLAWKQLLGALETEQEDFLIKKGLLMGSLYPV